MARDGVRGLGGELPTSIGLGCHPADLDLNHGSDLTGDDLLFF